MTIKWTANEWKPNFWCRLFGHKWVDGWYGSEPYVKVEYYTVDNVGTEHLNLMCRCDRCDKDKLIARVHLSTVEAAVKRAYTKHPHLKIMAGKE